MNDAAWTPLIEDYRASARAYAEPDDGTEAWSARVNEAADRMIVIARRVASAGPEAVAGFSELVGGSDPQVARWAAHHLLDFMEPPAAAREAALALIERAALSSSGEEVWLENWRGETQDE